MDNNNTLMNPGVFDMNEHLTLLQPVIIICQPEIGKEKETETEQE